MLTLEPVQGLEDVRTVALTVDADSDLSFVGKVGGNPGPLRSYSKRLRGLTGQHGLAGPPKP